VVAGIYFSQDVAALRRCWSGAVFGGSVQHNKECVNMSLMAYVLIMVHR